MLVKTMFKVLFSLCIACTPCTEGKCMETVKDANEEIIEFVCNYLYPYNVITKMIDVFTIEAC